MLKLATRLRLTRIVEESDYSPAVALYRQENLKALNKNKILTSNKGQDSNKQKITGNNSHLDLVNMNAYIKFGEFCQFVLKILS